MLRYVRPLVFRALDTITQQVAMVEQGVSQARTASAELEEAWIGEDAQAFLAEVKSGLLPQATGLIATILGIRLAFEKAAEIIEAADQAARGVAQELNELYSRI